MEGNKIIFEKYIDEGEFLAINSGIIDDLIKYINDNNVKNIFINKHYGYNETNLEFLKYVPSIEKISIETFILDISGLKHVLGLKYLWIVDEISEKFDFSQMKVIETLGITWNTKVYGLSEIKSLKKLSLTKFSFFKNSISSLNKLRYLSLSKPQKLIGLDILESLTCLETFKMIYCKNLTTIDRLEEINGSLKNLEFDHCPNIKSWNVLNKLHGLKELIISNSSPLPNLNFIDNMSYIKHFSFVGTEVEDGNLDKCIGIDYVGFNNKKKYNHTFEELNPNWGK